MQKKIILSACIFFVSMMSAFLQSGAMTSVSRVDWTKPQFVSSVSFDTEKAGISLPSGKNAAAESMYLKLPALIKDPLLSLYVDNAKQLGDLILDGTLTLKEITDIVYGGKTTSASPPPPWASRAQAGRCWPTTPSLASSWSSSSSTSRATCRWAPSRCSWWTCRSEEHSSESSQIGRAHV